MTAKFAKTAIVCSGIVGLAGVGTAIYYSEWIGVPVALLSMIFCKWTTLAYERGQR